MSEHSLTIAVTGALGLVGSAVTSLALSQGHKVLGLDLFDTTSARIKQFAHEAGYTYKQLSALDYKGYRDACKDAGVNALVHLAAKFNLHDKEGLFLDDVPQWDVHNANVAMSYNTLCIAAELGINRVVLASSVNSIGMVFSKRPTFDYLPVDERHQFRPEDAYSLSKYFCELQSDAFVRRHPSLRIATLRFHWVVSTDKVNAATLDAHRGAWKDLWGWVSVEGAARAVLLSLTAPTSTFPEGTHETFFIVAPTICEQRPTRDLVAQKYPEIAKANIRTDLKGNEGLFDCSKAQRMLGWTEKGFPLDVDNGYKQP